MENVVIRKRLLNIRKHMEFNKIDVYMVPTADYHNSEYVSEYFHVREYLSGFKGSNGTLVISKSEAGLWTDGRYFIQAEMELKGTGISLYKMQEEGVPTILEFLSNTMIKGETLEFDGRVIDTEFGIQLEKTIGNDITIHYESQLAALLWQERPTMPCERVYLLQEKFTGLDTISKIYLVKSQMIKNKVKGFFLSKLDDIMWLFNIRGQDVPCNPVALSYAYITLDNIYLFLQKDAITEEIIEYSKNMKFEVLHYEDMISFLNNKIGEEHILVDYKNTSYYIYKALSKSSTCINLENPTTLLKAIKNKTEIECMKEVYLLDSVAVVKFIYWLKTNVGKMMMDEVSAGKYLDALRKKTDGFVDFSFQTICAYKENAAMMHYEGKKEDCKNIINEGMLLVDSGGQYYGGTTDVTRTIVLGEVSEEIKKHFTAVVIGMLQLSDTQFLYGCTGRNLDILARMTLWNMNLDYKCGTGHGIGCMLNVHEGPQNIRWRYQKDVPEIIFEENMVVSNEPGVYIKGSHGIRIENIMICKKAKKSQYGQFMKFETLTFVPIDIDGISLEMLSEQQKKQFNDYHKNVYKKMSPFLTQKEKKWLAHVTKEI
ncbi:MAG TPA: aminopeptidase P family protein [Lachnospiraceae bacterium]|nr:aminopeptidase P family protein [Lachnospiraceae bacterium]